MQMKNVHIISTEVCLNYVHMFVEISLKMSVLQFMGFLKRKNSIMIYEKQENMKFKYRNR